MTVTLEIERGRPPVITPPLPPVPPVPPEALEVWNRSITWRRFMLDRP